MTDTITKALDAGQRVVDLLPNQWFETFVDPRELRVVLPAAREELARLHHLLKMENVGVRIQSENLRGCIAENARLRSELAAARAPMVVTDAAVLAIAEYVDTAPYKFATDEGYFENLRKAIEVALPHLRPALLPSEGAVARVIFEALDCVGEVELHKSPNVVDINATIDLLALDRMILALFTTAPSADAGESPARTGKDDVQDAINERLKHWRPEPSAEAIRAEEREAVLRDLDATVAEDAAGHEGEVWIIERAKARIRASSTAKGGADA